MNVLKKVWHGLDGVVDGLVGMIRPKKHVKGEDLPGRNDPCSCGSGKKFKRCCEQKVLREVRSQGELPGGRRWM